MGKVGQLRINILIGLLRKLSRHKYEIQAKIQIQLQPEIQRYRYRYTSVCLCVLVCVPVLARIFVIYNILMLLTARCQSPLPPVLLLGHSAPGLLLRAWHRQKTIR